MKQPLTKTVPMAISIAMVIVTVLYLLANLAYIIVLTPTEIVASSAVAVTYGAKITFVLFYLMPVFVTMSSFGTVNSNIMSSSRLLLVAARQNHLPRMFSLIGQQNVSPIPALLFRCQLPLFSSDCTKKLDLFTQKN